MRTFRAKRDKARRGRYARDAPRFGIRMRLSPCRPRRLPLSPSGAQTVWVRPGRELPPLLSWVSAADATARPGTEASPAPQSTCSSSGVSRDRRVSATARDWLVGLPEAEAMPRSDSPRSRLFAQGGHPAHSPAGAVGSVGVRVPTLRSRRSTSPATSPVHPPVRAGEVRRRSRRLRSSSASSAREAILSVAST